MQGTHLVERGPTTRTCPFLRGFLEETNQEAYRRYWLRFELLWRDYFAIIALKYGNQFFKLEGIRGALDRNYSKNAKNDWKASDLEAGEKSVVKRWLEGRTGVP